MRIIVSPAKTMKMDNDIFAPRSTPTYIKEAEFIMDALKAYTLDEAISLWKVSHKIGLEAYEKTKAFDGRKNISPAIFTYEGLQYKHISPKVLDEKALEYIQKNLCILSGVYGCVYAFEGISPYRLEMQSALPLEYRGKSYKNLYEFWDKKIYERVMNANDDGIIINLASKEYSDCITPFLKKKDKMITCIFGEYDKNGKLKVKATNAKMARGYMVRFMAENNVTDPNSIKNFQYIGFKYNQDLSTDTEYVYIMDK